MATPSQTEQVGELREDYGEKSPFAAEDKSPFQGSNFEIQERTEMGFEEMWGRLPNARWKYVGRMLDVKLFDDATAATTGDGKYHWFVPPELDGTKLVRVVGYVSTVSSSGALTIQINNVTQSLDMLSTALTIDQSEKTSITAATPAVIKDTIVLRPGDELRFDVDGAGTGAKGLLIHLSFI